MRGINGCSSKNQFSTLEKPSFSIQSCPCVIYTGGAVDAVDAVDDVDAGGMYSAPHF